jgi:hypothetical protein
VRAAGLRSRLHSAGGTATNRFPPVVGFPPRARSCDPSSRCAVEVQAEARLGSTEEAAGSIPADRSPVVARPTGRVHEQVAPADTGRSTALALMARWKARQCDAAAPWSDRPFRLAEARRPADRFRPNSVSRAMAPAARGSSGERCGRRGSRPGAPTSSRTCRSTSSRIARRSSSARPAGVRNSYASTVVGTDGQASPQTMVTAQSACSCISSDRRLARRR